MSDAPDDDDGDAPPGELVLVPTFPPAPTLPRHVALERVAAPAPVAPADLGPFRTAGAPYVDRRADAVVIATRPSHVVPAVAAGFAAVAIALAIANASFAVAGLLAGAVLLGAILLRDAPWMRRNCIEITATHVIARAGSSPAIHRLPRGAVTRLTCVPDLPLPGGPRLQYRGYDLGGEPHRRWGVYTYDGDERIRLADVGNHRDATAIAAQLAHELGLPTWVPAPDDD